MKHVFWIHSNITYLVCKKIIELKKLDNESCVVFLTRKYELPANDLKIKTIKFPYYFDNKNFKPIFKLNDVKGTKERLDEIKKIVYKATEYQQFYFYIPISRSEPISCIIKMKECLGYYLIEEGLVAYSSFNSIDHRGRLEKIKSFFKSFYSNRIEYYKDLYFVNKPILYVDNQFFLGAYSITEKSFNFIDKNKRHIINPFITSENSLVIDAIIVFDGLVSFNKIKLESLLKSLEEKIIPLIKEKGYSKVGYKFHIEQTNFYEDEILPIKKLLKEKLNIDLIELEPEFILEEYIAINKPDIIGTISSVLFYGSLLGSTIYSVSEYLCTIEPEFENTIKKVEINALFEESNWNQL